MTLKEIKRAINTVLKKMYPDVKIYGADTIEGYTRPAFFAYVTQTFSEKTKNAVHKNVEIEIDLIQKWPDELAAMEFFEKMEAAFGYKLAVGDRKLNTDNMDYMFEGENDNIPVVTFEVEFWDEIKREDNSEIMKNMEMRQEVEN